MVFKKILNSNYIQMPLSKLDTHTLKILEEIPWVDIKPFSHNIISLELGIISENYGKDVSNQLIKDFKLDKMGWHPVE